MKKTFGVVDMFCGADKGRDECIIKYRFIPQNVIG